MKGAVFPLWTLRPISTSFGFRIRFPNDERSPISIHTCTTFGRILPKVTWLWYGARSRIHNLGALFYCCLRKSKMAAFNRRRLLLLKCLCNQIFGSYFFWKLETSSDIVYHIKNRIEIGPPKKKLLPFKVAKLGDSSRIFSVRCDVTSRTHFRQSHERPYFNMAEPVWGTGKCRVADGLNMLNSGNRQNT